MPGAVQTYTGPIEIQDGVFKVNGTKKFLMFASYFGALRDAVLHPDWLISILDSAKQLGFDGVRVFPTWWWNPDTNCTNFDPYPLLKGNGYVNMDPLSGVPAIPAGVYQPPNGYHNSVAGRFQFLLDMAWEKGLVVDVSFAVETVNGLHLISDPGMRAAKLAEYGQGLSQLALGLKTATYHGNGPSIPQTGYRHLFFDLENETNYAVGCKPALNATELSSLKAKVNEGDTARLVTASTAADQQPPNAWAWVAPANLNIVSYHDPRNIISGYQWWQLTNYWVTNYRSITNDAIPIYFGEPERHRYEPSSCDQNGYFPPPGCSNNYGVGAWIAASTNAKLAGAAAWTFHTEKLFRYASNYAPGLSQVEYEFVTTMMSHLNQIDWPRD